MKIAIIGARTDISKSIHLRMKLLEMYNEHIEAGGEILHIMPEFESGNIDKVLEMYSIPNESYFDDNCNDDLTQREKELESLENLRKSKRKWKR